MSRDHVGQRLFVVKEHSPLRVLDGWPEAPAGFFNLPLAEWKSPRAASLFMTDLSSLTLHEPTGNL